MSGEAARRTSLLAYETIREQGLLSRQRWLIYDVLYRHGPVTINECFKILEKERGSWNWNTRTRFGELVEMGVAEEVGERECRHSGMLCIVYDVTSSLPRKLERKNLKGKLSDPDIVLLRSVWKRCDGQERLALERAIALANRRR